MTQLAATPSKLLLTRDQLANALAPHLRAIVLACVAVGSLLLLTAPGAAQSRCMLAGQAAFSGQAAIALAMSVTTLAWYFHKSIGQRIGALRERIARGS